MEVRTLCDLFYDSVTRHNKPDHLKFKAGESWHAISSDEYRQAVEELSMGLRELGLAPGDRVAILSENRPEWAFADLASLLAGALDVPIYPTLTPQQVLYILRDCGAKAVFVSTSAQARKVAEIRNQAPDLRHVIRMDDEPLPDTLALSELRARGREALAKDPAAVKRRAAEVTPDSLATLIYTSGTTGEPKGVMLLHSNLVSNVIASLAAFRGIGRDDLALSFLPLCHVFERMGGHYLMLHIGATIAYAESIDKVPANLLEVRPTVMLSVPRLYEKMYARIQEKVAADPPLRQRIFRWALAVGREAFKHQLAGAPPGLWLRLQRFVAQKLVFDKISARTGGRLRVFVSGSAPLSREIAEFFGACGMPILEGYGLTETSPVICVNLPHRMKPGSVGPPIPGIEVKIAPDGEILTRGPHVMKGYYNKPEATAEAIEADGWFHTGDIGVLDPDGFLIITDRKKDLLATSGGKKIAPQPIETRIKRHPFIAEVVMIGNKRNFPAALVIPNFTALEAWAKEKQIAWSSREELVRSPAVAAHYEALIKELTPDLAQFERIKRICLLSREFSIDAGELTPTMKVRRRVVEERYKDVIDQLYAGGPG